MSQKELLQKVETEVANLEGELERLKTAMSPQDACKAIFKAMEKENPDPFMAPGNEWAKASGGGEGGCGCTIA